MSKYLTFLLFVNLNLLAQTQILRGPYLQKGTSTSIQVNYRTNNSVVTKIKYGLTLGNLNNEVVGNDFVVDHYLTVPNLLPETKYYYGIYKNDSLMQGDALNYFITPAVIGSSKKTRIWVTGDCGTGQTTQTNVLTQMENYLGTNYLDAWILLGDNAYSNGLDLEYQTKFFEPYQNRRFMKQTVIWPSPGNHDYGGSPGRQVDHNVSYYAIFKVPAQAELGGVASNTPHFYSYNLHNIHFISLDSYGINDGKRLSDTIASPQVEWLKQDLAANNQKWTVVYFHHPPYTMGTHNSDTENELRYLREKLLPIFDRYKIDLVLCGHSHTYERSKPLRNYYGYENDFVSAIHNTSSSSGKYDGSSDSCPYVKHSNATNEGIVYVVAGSAGWTPGGQASFPHEALPFANKTNAGSMILEVEGNRLDAKWISENGLVDDKFTIVKDDMAPKDSLVIVPSNQTSVSLKAGLKDSYVWKTNGSTSGTIVLNEFENGQIFRVSDNFGCLTDKFTIQKTPNCISNKVQSNIYESGSAVKLEVSGTINSNKIIENNTNTKFDAGQFVILSPGFSVEKGAVFKAYIDGCGNF